MDISNIIYRKYTLTTGKTPEEVIQIIYGNIVKEQLLFFYKDIKEPFEGNTSIRNLDFSIHKKISGRNSFVAILNGKIQPNTSGSTIDLKIRLPWFTIIFSIFFIGNIIRMLILAIASQNQNKIDGITTFAFFALILFCIFWYVYNSSAKSALEILTKLLQAEIVSAPKKMTENQGRFNR